jgi:CheY-like chemotaxis protein
MPGDLKSDSQHPRATEARSVRPERLLVVEDDDDVRLSIKHMLVRAGYEVSEAANGEAACEVLRTQAAEIRLVLTDLVMPTMGGAELADFLHALYPGIPVILMTGYAELADSDPPGVLAKPFSPSELIAIIQRTLAAASGRPS